MLFQIFEAIQEILASIIFDHPFYGLFTFLTVFLTFKIVKPLFRMWKLKLKHGKDIYYKYIPIAGIMQVMRKSYKTKGNVHIWVAEVINKQPEVKMIVSNTITGLVYVVVDPDYYKPLYLDHHLVSKTDVSGAKDFLLDGGLLFSEGQKWKEQRQILGDHFLFSKLKSRIPMMNEVIREKIKTTQIEKVFEFVCSITGEVVIRSFFGDETKNWKIDGKDAQIEIGDVFSTLVRLRISNLLVYFKQMFLGKKSWNYCIKAEKDLLYRVTKVRQDIKSIIEKRIVKMKQEGYTQNEDRDFLDVQLDFYFNKNQQKEYQITIDDIVAQFATLFLGGTDTTAALIANTLFLLSENTHFIQDLRDEVKTILKDNNDVITAENINKLILIEAALKETLRIKPSVVYPVPRVANQDFYIQNILIKKGDAFLIANSFANTKQRYYDNPFQYNPKRWLQSQPIKEDNGFINIPFAAGGRNCIGQHMAMIEARIILAYIIKDYNITRNPNVQKTQWPSRGVSTFLPPDAVHLQKI